MCCPCHWKTGWLESKQHEQAQHCCSSLCLSWAWRAVPPWQPVTRGTAPHSGRRKHCPSQKAPLSGCPEALLMKLPKPHPVTVRLTSLGLRLPSPLSCSESRPDSWPREGRVWEGWIHSSRRVASSPTGRKAAFFPFRFRLGLCFCSTCSAYAHHRRDMISTDTREGEGTNRPRKEAEKGPSSPSPSA